MKSDLVFKENQPRSIRLQQNVDFEAYQPKPNLSAADPALPSSQI